MRSHRSVQSWSACQPNEQFPTDSSSGLMLIVSMCIQTADLCIRPGLSPPPHHYRMIISASYQLHPKVTLVENLTGFAAEHGSSGIYGNGWTLCCCLLFGTFGKTTFGTNWDLFLLIIKPHERRPEANLSGSSDHLCAKNGGMLHFYILYLHYGGI